MIFGVGNELSRIFMQLASVKTQSNKINFIFLIALATSSKQKLNQIDDCVKNIHVHILTFSLI